MALSASGGLDWVLGKMSSQVVKHSTVPREMENGSHHPWKCSKKSVDVALGDIV